MNSFVLAYSAVVFRKFGVSFKTEVKLGASHNGQKATCRKTVRISLAGCARSVLVALRNRDDEATMVHVHETFLPTFEALLMVPQFVVFDVLSINE